jgi:hypothetical protein
VLDWVLTEGVVVNVRICLVGIILNQELGLVHREIACMFRTMERRNLRSFDMPV